MVREKKLKDDQFFEISLKLKRMACNMAAMIDWPSEEKMQRAGGDAICPQCGLSYFAHPQENGLTLTCDGRLLKL